MNEIELENADVNSIKTRIKDNCFSVIKYWSYLSDIEEIKKYKYGYKIDGTEINIYERKLLIYLAIEIIKSENGKTKLRYSSLISYYVIPFYALFFIPLFIKLFINTDIPYALFVYPIIAFTVILLISYWLKSKALKKFVQILFNDSIIKVS